MRFADRTDAGRELAGRLRHLDGRGAVVLALPRGGIPVGAEVARALGAPLDVLVVRKLGVPGHEELAMGAIASGGVRVVDRHLRAMLGIDDATLERVVERETRELERRERAYRGDGRPLGVEGKVVVLVDDGLATGATMRAAVQAIRQAAPARVVVAAPVGSVEACEALEREADEVVCADRPDPFWSVGTWYGDFGDLPDADLRAMLTRDGVSPGRPQPA